MTSGDIGTTFVIALNGLGYTVPPGTTGTFIAKPGYPFVGAPELSFGPTFFSLDGSTAFYITQGNGLDFQSAGNWIYKVRVKEPSGRQFDSPPGQTFVLPA